MAVSVCMFIVKHFTRYLLTQIWKHRVDAGRGACPFEIYNYKNGNVKRTENNKLTLSQKSAVNVSSEFT